MKRFIKFSQVRDNNELFESAENKVESFLTDLAVKQNVATSTQNQAFNALVFLYKNMLDRPLENVRPTRGRKEARLPVVLSVKEVLAKLQGTNTLIVQDIDFEYSQITVRVC